MRRSPDTTNGLLITIRGMLDTYEGYIWEKFTCHYGNETCNFPPSFWGRGVQTVSRAVTTNSGPHEVR